MTRVEQIFQKYQLNYKGTMSRFVEKEDFYLRCLALFFQDDSLEKLKQAIDEKAYQAAFDAAHTLKGVAGNMGLDFLFQAVCRIVEPLRSLDETVDYSSLCDEILQEYEKARRFHQELLEK